MNQYSNTTAEMFASIFEEASGRFYEVQHAGIMWDKVIPYESIDKGVNPGANSMSYMVDDFRGMGSFRARQGGDVPSVSLTYGKNIVPIEVGGVSARIDTDELRQIQYGMRMDLRNRYPETMRKAVDLHNESAFFFGDRKAGFAAFLDYPGVPAGVAAARAGGSETEWETKTPDEIIADLNTAMAGIWQASAQTHLPNWVALPPSKFGLVSSTPRSAASDYTILSYFRKNNLYTNLTGEDIDVVSLPYLETAGVSGAARMIAGERSVKNFVLPYSIRPTLLDPQYTGFSINLFAEYKFGSVHLPYPMAFSYTDGI